MHRQQNIKIQKRCFRNIRVDNGILAVIIITIRIPPSNGPKWFLKS